MIRGEALNKYISNEQNGREIRSSGRTLKRDRSQGTLKASTQKHLLAGWIRSPQKPVAPSPLHNLIIPYHPCIRYHESKPSEAMFISTIPFERSLLSILHQPTVWKPLQRDDSDLQDDHNTSNIAEVLQAQYLVVQSFI